MHCKEYQIDIAVLSPDENLLPVYRTDGSAGADVKANLKEPLILAPGMSVLVPTGLRFAIPSGYEIQVRPRSGLALNHQITVLNSPGTIDSDYRGELGIILINHGTSDFVITHNMRIAQLVIAPVVLGNFVLTEELTETNRGLGGFGHTGNH